MAREINGQPIRQRAGQGRQERNDTRFRSGRTPTAALVETAPLYECYTLPAGQADKSIVTRQLLRVFDRKVFHTTELTTRQLDRQDKKTKGLPYTVDRKSDGLTWNADTCSWMPKTKIAKVNLHLSTVLVETTDRQVVSVYNPADLLIRQKPFGENQTKRESSRTKRITIDTDCRLPGSDPSTFQRFGSDIFPED